MPCSIRRSGIIRGGLFDSHGLYMALQSCTHRLELPRQRKYHPTKIPHILVHHSKRLQITLRGGQGFVPQMLLQR